jgi:hypothetical protein
MSTTLSLTQSDSARQLLPTKPPVKATTLRQADEKGSSITTGALARFLITFCIGIGVTVACAPVRASKPAPSQAPPERNVSSEEKPMGPLHGISF